VQALYQEHFAGPRPRERGQHLAAIFVQMPHAARDMLQANIVLEAQ
jgi:hypothetical protein